jgi:hypothetical protein
LWELKDWRSGLTVIVPLVETTSVHVAVMVPLKMTFCVVADAVWPTQATSSAAPAAARRNFIDAPLSSADSGSAQGGIIPSSWLI